VHRDERGGLVEVGQLPEGVHPEQDRPQPGALGGAGEAHGQVERRGQRVHPQGGGDRAAGRPHLVDRQVEGGEGVADERELLADPLDGGAHEVGPAVLASQAEVGAAHAGPPPGRPLAQQVGQAQQPLAAGGHVLGLVEQPRVELVGRLALGHGPVDRAGERQRRPADDRAAVVDGAADHPVVVGERVAEQPAGRVDGRSRHHDAHRAAGAERDRGDARPHRADAEVGEHAVGGADDDRQVGGEPGGPRDVGAQAVEQGGRRDDLRQLRLAHAGDLHRLGVPATGHEVVAAGRAAQARSTTSLRPHRALTSSSFTPPHRAVERISSGSCSAHQASFTIGDIGWTGVPVRACTPCARPSARSAAAWAEARLSAQVASGPSGVPSLVIGTSPCIAALSDNPTTRSPRSCAARATWVSASTAARMSRRASSSAQPGAGTSSGYPTLTTSRTTASAPAGHRLGRRGPGVEADQHVHASSPRRSSAAVGVVSSTTPSADHRHHRDPSGVRR
jgi:hypothetical protein